MGDNLDLPWTSGVEGSLVGLSPGPGASAPLAGTDGVTVELDCMTPGWRQGTARCGAETRTSELGVRS